MIRVISKHYKLEEQKINKLNIIIEIIIFAYTLLFIYAALNKLIDYEKFVIQIGQSPLLTGLGSTIPWFVITIELIITIMFYIPRLRLFALHGAYSLMVMFTTYIIAILNLGSFVPCSCGGVLEQMGWTEHLIFNMVFVLIGLIGILIHPKMQPKQTQSSNK